MSAGRAGRVTAVGFDASGLVVGLVDGRVEGFAGLVGVTEGFVVGFVVV